MNSQAYYSQNECLPYYGKVGVLAQALNANISVVAGQLLIPELTANANDVQTIAFTGTVTGGTYILSFNNVPTVAIAYNATAATVQTALSNLANIGAGNVAVTGGPGPATPLVVTFQGALANQPQPVIVANFTGLTGTTPAMTVTHTTTGVANGKFKLYAGSGVPVIARYDYTTDEQGMITTGVQSVASEHRRPLADVIISGIFKVGSLTGLDATAVTNMGARLLNGPLSDPTTLILIPGVGF